MKFRFKLNEELSNEYDSEGNQLTKEQAEFFKNSKIRDSKGRLLVCRHSTESEFDEFQYKYLSEGKLGYGFYFILDEQRREQERQLYKINWSPKYRKACYLNVTNPAYDEDVDDIINAQWNFEEQNRSASQKEIIDFTSHKFNCDGIISYDRNSVVCFYPDQIKSITNKTPTNSDNINESLMMKDGMYVFDTASSLINFLKNQKKDIRILYDANVDKYFACDGDEYIHWDILKQAYKEGYYHKFIDREWELDGYQYDGVYGSWDENDEEIDPYLYYIIFSPDNSFEIGTDDYDKQYDTSIGRFLTRDSDLEEIDLYDVVRRHMK